MQKKEERSGELNNKEIEKEISRNNRPDTNGRNYAGSQDTGEQIVRNIGSEVQRNDGLPPEEKNDGSNE